MANKGTKKKKCFIIAPIGEEGSDTRNRSDKVLKHIIRPAVKECNYEPIRADKIAEPGIITSQVIQRLLNDDLVIADLTEKNPNVYYELAVRHAVNKPFVQIIEEGESISFDIAGMRTISVNHHDLDSADNCKQELIKQIHFVEKDMSKVDTPISVAIDLESLRKSKNPLEKSTTKIISMLQDIRSEIGEISSVSRHSRFSSSTFEELTLNLARLSSVLDLPKDEKMSREQLDRAQHSLYRITRTLEMFMMESDFPPDMIRHFLRRIRRNKPGLRII